MDSKPKLNYKIQLPKQDDSKKGFQPKTKTKLSMQGLVGSVLASKQPSGPGQPMSITQQNGAGGWGKAN